MSKENKTKKKLFKRRPKEKKLNRSMAGNTLLFVIMFICGTSSCNDYQQCVKAAG